MSRAGTEVVVPMYRERESLAGLFAALAGSIPGIGTVEVLFVDDGSDDGTAAACQELIDAQALGAPARLLRHRRNLGLTQALRTGFHAGRAPVVCWLDADLSYEPAILAPLVAAVAGGADVAVASPYHPDGAVEAVPPVRALLSRGLSRAWRLIEGRGPWTWSSMVRAWRRSCLARCLPERPGHVGVTESLVRAHAIGARIVEVPARLTGRRTGSSGLRVVPGIVGHLALMRAAVTGGLTAPGPTP